MSPLRRAILFDRDGVLNRRIPDGYVLDPQGFEWLPGARTALRQATEAGLVCAVVTNQACIGRGLASAETIQAIHDRMVSEAFAAGGRIDGVFVCPHRPEDGCDCRKPKPGLVYQAAQALGLDLSASLLIGDSPTDIQAAATAGVPAIRVGPRPHVHTGADSRAPTVGWAPDAAAAVARWLRDH